MVTAPVGPDAGGWFRPRWFETTTPGYGTGVSLTRRALDRAERMEGLDRPADVVQRLADGVFPDTRGITMRLSGSRLGHPVHPALVAAPIGAWMSAGLLDLMPGHEDAARRLVLSGVVAAVPTAATGAVEFRKLRGEQRRIGVLHLLANVTASTCYLTSYLQRRRGGTGRGAALLGLAAVSLGGLLGGHLTYALGAGVFRWRSDRAAPQPSPAPPGREPVAAGAREP